MYEIAGERDRFKSCLKTQREGVKNVWKFRLTQKALDSAEAILLVIIRYTLGVINA